MFQERPLAADKEPEELPKVFLQVSQTLQLLQLTLLSPVLPSSQGGALASVTYSLKDAADLFFVSRKQEGDEQCRLLGLRAGKRLLVLMLAEPSMP